MLAVTTRLYYVLVSLSLFNPHTLWRPPIFSKIFYYESVRKGNSAGGM
jgi:hypothetical protein